MSEAGKQQEPSMEEILASIRKIISEDSDDDAAPQAQAAPQPEPEEEEPLELTDEVQPADEHELEVFDAPQPEPEPEPEPAPEPEPQRAYVPQPAPQPSRAPEPPAYESPDSIVSAATAAAGISSFSQLSRSVKSGRPGITVEQLAEELMRPMLRQWLDENLPGMVERLVRREIERMARAGEEN